MNQSTKAGLYLTVIVHLVALIVVLAFKITSLLQQESSFVLDFSKYEAQQAELERQVRRVELNAQLEELIASSRSQLRNVAVEANTREQRAQNLRDDRHTNPNEVYDQARELQAKLDAARKAVEDQQGMEEVASLKKETKEETKVAPYTGPSVLDWTLDGRKAQSLPIPVYKCMGGGDVTVAIGVNRKGYVTQATIVAAFSSQDHCLQEFALRAAKQSRFSASQNAPAVQVGEIVYRFIPQ